MCADSCRAAHAVGALPSTAEGGPGAEERVQEHTALTRWGGGGREGRREKWEEGGSSYTSFMYMYSSELRVTLLIRGETAYMYMYM